MNKFIDQELISYRYSSCSCCSCSYWGELFKKSPRLHAPSFQIRTGWNLAGIFFMDGVFIWCHNFKMADLTSYWVKRKHLPHEYAETPVSSWPTVHSYLLSLNVVPYFDGIVYQHEQSVQSSLPRYGRLPELTVLLITPF